MSESPTKDLRLCPRCQRNWISGEEQCDCDPTSNECFACESEPKAGNDPCVICGRATIPPLQLPQNEVPSSKEHFNNVEPLWLFGKPDDYGEADASNMELCAEYIEMRCDGDLTVAQARALRDWLNRVIPPHGTSAPLDAQFYEALDACGIKEPLAVYDSNSYRRVGLAGQYRELVYAEQQRSDGHLSIHGTALLRAMVAAFNAMLTKRSDKEPKEPRESDWHCVHCGRDNDPSETHCVQCEWSRKHTIHGVLHERGCFDHPCICGAAKSANEASGKQNVYLSRGAIRGILLSHGFKIQDGFNDLKPYVYEAVDAVLTAADLPKEPTERCPHGAVVCEKCVRVAIAQYERSAKETNGRVAVHGDLFPYSPWPRWTNSRSALNASERPHVVNHAGDCESYCWCQMQPSNGLENQR